MFTVYTRTWLAQLVKSLPSSYKVPGSILGFSDQRIKVMVLLASVVILEECSLSHLFDRLSRVDATQQGWVVQRRVEFNPEFRKNYSSNCFIKETITVLIKYC